LSPSTSWVCLHGAYSPCILGVVGQAIDEPDQNAHAFKKWVMGVGQSPAKRR